MKAPRPAEAVALEYDWEGAPRVTAKGTGPIADAILAAAREHGVPIQEDAALVGLLGQVPLGDEIPEALYVAVAELLGFVYSLCDDPPEGARRDRS